MSEQKTQKQNIGNAGEYYIASRLSALDFTATITLGRAEKYDILALSPSGRLSKISVKTKHLENTNDFILSAKDEKGSTKDFYYVFVKLNEFKKEPDFWVIPEVVVEIAADEITKSPNHTSGLALRFPRLVKFRDDRSAEDATNITELTSIFGLQKA